MTLAEKVLTQGVKLQAKAKSSVSLKSRLIRASKAYTDCEDESDVPTDANITSYPSTCAPEGMDAWVPTSEVLSYVTVSEMSMHDWHMASVEKTAPLSFGKVQLPVWQFAVIVAELLSGGERRPRYRAACMEAVKRGLAEAEVISASKFWVLGIWPVPLVTLRKHGSYWMICWEKGSTATAAMVMMAPRYASQL